MKHQFSFRVFAAAVSALVLVTSSALADYPSTVLSDAPAGYWRLGEMPVTLADPYRVTNSGSLGAAANGVFAGYVGRQEAGALAGSDDTAMRFWGNVAELSRVTFSSGASFNFTGNGAAMPFTLEVWAKPMSAPSGSQRMIANGSSGQGYAFTLQGNNTLRITAFGVADVTSDVYSPTFVSNQWYHLVLVRSSASAYFYVNGAQLGAPKSLTNIKTTANPLTLGRNAAGGEPFTGVLDEPAVYTNTLTLERIAAHYYAGLTNGAGYDGVILADNPFGYWRLNEPTKTESTSVVANSGSLGTSANGAVFGGENSISGGLTGALVGDVNPAMGFAGGGARINVPFNAALNTASYTVECWARLDTWNNAYQSPVSDRFVFGGAYQGFVLYAAPFNTLPRWEFWNCTGTAFHNVNSGVADVVTNQWTHVVGTYDAASGTKVLYVDGQIVGGAVNVVNVPNMQAPLRIAGGANEAFNYGDYFWNGGLDEVAVYPSALSPQRVQAHYEAALGTSPAVTNAPTVGANPVSVTNWAPYPVMLNCVIKGSLPMQLQWYHVATDGVTITAVPNGTNMTLTLDPTSPALDGNYYLAATNSLGSAESAWAYVEITPLAAPTFTLNAPPTVPVYAGGTASIPVMAEGTPTITYQWQSNTVNIVGATNPVLSLPNVQASHATATFQAKASNLVSVTTSDPAQLAVLTPPDTTYAAEATGLNPLAYWRLGDLPPGTFAFDYWGGHLAVYVGAVQGSTPGALLDDDDGAVALYGTGYYVRTLESEPFNFSGFQDFTLSAFVKANAAVPDNTPARIFSNWQTVGLSSGYGFGFYGMAKLRFTAFGVVDLDANVAGLTTDQWYHLAAVRSSNMVYLYIDGQLANSGTVGAIRTSSYPLQLGGNPNAATTESFNGVLDEAAVFNRALTASEIAGLYAARYGTNSPPTIVRQPLPQTLYVGGTARFDVVATGSDPMSYQWKTNGIVIPGATSASLVVSGLTLANNNVNYSVTLSNPAGVLPSDSVLLTVLQPAGYAGAVVADNPVGLWRLGESAGPIAFDYWGGYNGLDNGTTPLTYGIPGALFNDANTAASFDGYGSKIEIPYTAALNPTNFTVEAWAKVTGGQGTYRALVSARDEGTGFEKGFIIYATSGNIWSFWVGDGPNWQTLNGPPVVLDQWTHLAAVYDGQTKYFYVNGALVGSQTIGYVPNDLRPIRIGAGKNESVAGDYWFYGTIDEVAIYNTVLPAERVEYHYLLGKYSDITAPFIVQEPVSQTVLAGSPAAFNATAGGSPDLNYQWWKDGAAVPGANDAKLAFASAAYADNGIYTLWITNSLGYTNTVAATLAVMPPPAFALVTNDLVLHLKFENDYNDASGRANHGSAMGSPLFVPGKIGANALRYNTDTTNGFYNYVTLGTPTDLSFGVDVSFSVAYWVRFTGTPGDLPFLCSAVNSYGNFGFTFAPSYNGGGWSWSLGNGAGYIGVYGPDNSINDGTWHHLVHTFDRAGAVATGITYLDGVQVDARSVAVAGNIDSGNMVNIGQDPTGVYPESGTAELDDLGIWRRVLNGYEALSIYTAGQQSGSSFDTVGPIQLTVQRDGNDLELIWQAGVLCESSEVSGTYTPVSGATPPYFKVTPDVARKFYRVLPATP